MSLTTTGAPISCRFSPGYPSRGMVSSTVPTTVSLIPTVVASGTMSPQVSAMMAPSGSYGPPVTTLQPLPTSGVVSCERVIGTGMPSSLPAITVPAADGTLNAPPRLTSGLPDPTSIAKQREQYLKALEEQERQAIGVLEQQRAQQVTLLRAQGDQQKKKFCLEVNQQVNQNDIVLTQQHSEQMMVLNQQYSQQRGILENQANTLIMDYQQKKAQEDMMLQQYQLQVDQFNAQQKYNEEMVRLQTQTDKVQGAMAQAYATSYMPPPIARQRTYLPSITGLGTGPITAMGNGSYQPAVIA